MRRAPRAGRATRVLAVLAATAALLASAGCGEKAEPAAGGPATLTVSAAASLKTALDAYGEAFADATVRAQYAGSDELAAQIRQGVRPDVYAAANTTLPQQLFQAGLLERPRVFAGNELVLAVPARDAAVRGLDDLGRDGVRIAVGARGVPVGAYTRAVLARLGAARERAILANVRSEEPDVNGVVGKLSQGAADAGFVYRTDVTAADGTLRAISLPARVRPAVAYAAAVVKGARQPLAARRYVEGLVSGRGREALRAAGFLPPP
jgi:molybdate transport system substrate-binding protein